VITETFTDLHLKVQNPELYEFNKAIQILEYIELNALNEAINEGLLADLMSKVSNSIKKKIDFIKEIASMAGQDISKLLVMFKDTRFFKIFKVIGFNVKKIVALYKKGVNTYNKIQNILAEKIASLGGVKYIKRHLEELDKWFDEHPVLKKLGGVAVAGLLFYIWTQMSFTPDLEYSMDFKDILSALAGSFSIADLFASDSGVTMLIYLASGMLLGLSTPWPGKQSTQIIGGLIFSAYRLLKPKGVKMEQPTK
jgi:hypothetical protein